MRVSACTALIRRHDREQNIQHELRHEYGVSRVAAHPRDQSFDDFETPTSHKHCHQDAERKTPSTLSKSAGAVSVVKLTR